MRGPGRAAGRAVLASAALAVGLGAGLATAQEAVPPADPPLSAEAFEAIVEGRTMDTHDSTGRYGVETFLPGRKAIWRDGERCLQGTWRPEGDRICFDYEGEPLPFCWTYHDRGGWLMAWFEGDRGAEPILLYPSQELVTCDGYFGV